MTVGVVPFDCWIGGAVMTPRQDLPQLLDPLTFPLRGSALIEASAGTGKTFTIAALYLRLVLGHGGAQAAFHEPLTPPQILVVTFTEAATKELRDRIRARLAQAADAFLQAEPIEDDLLAALRASYPESEWTARAQQLRVAADWMDEAAVSTIHGWCHRMLREHAFDSGSLFEQALEADQAELQDEAVRDYWRTFFYPLPPEDAACVVAWWASPEALRQALKPLLPHAERLDGSVPCGEALRNARDARERELAELRAPWAAWCEELQALLDAAYAGGRIDKVRLKKSNYDGWLQQLREWHAGNVDVPALTDAARKRLTVDGLREVWKPADAAPAHVALEALALLHERIACLPEGKDAVLAHAACWVAARLQAEQQRRAQMGFDDLLTRLHRALHGPQGARLAELIRAQFPVALIDEFQDTDPVQYGIFRQVYRPDAPQDRTALVLIGDPKQAIYAFRGADIYTYLQARRAAGRLATLGTNYRSSDSMVQAVNHLFLRAEQRASGDGAFLFRSREGNPLPFLPVQARGRDEHWEVEGDAPAALTCWWLDEGDVLKPAAYRERFAGACAAEIVRLLTLGQQQRAGFRGADGALRPLHPHDIAILVNNRDEADAVRGALRVLGVRSVYLSDQENVYRTPAAAEVQRLLAACASPDDGRLVRTALGTGLLGLDWAALDRLQHDELHWDARLEQFRAYGKLWQDQGVLPMLRRLLHDFHVPERLLASGDQRQLTDVLHLAELLQQASGGIEGEHALVRHLAEERQDGTPAADHRLLRLESDADLLKVVTVHKSKGLEYPLVFVPFATACRPVKADDVPLKWHDPEGRLHLSLQPQPALLVQAERERLGEDLRKMYVALTRARHATWIGVAPTPEAQRSALGYLLAGDEQFGAGRIEAVLRDAFGDCEGVAVQPAPEPAAEVFVPAAAPALLAEPPKLPPARPEHWWIASYSRLRKAGEPVPADAVPADAQEETWMEAAAAEAREVGQPAAPPAPGTLHAFPRGSSPGTFLHGLLEAVGRQGFAEAAAQPDQVRQMVARRTQAARWAPHREVLGAWLTQWLQVPWNLQRLVPGAAPVAPNALSSSQPEMEFWLGAANVDARELDALVCTHTLSGVARARLLPDTLNGMLKGFMDLVFEHEGRYYVADYKSNWLGPDDAAYGIDAMRDEVLHHRYELQYSLYLFALHRLLRARLPDYDYDRHVGGAVYIFLRGHAAASQGLHLERPPRALMDALDHLFAEDSA